MSQDIRRELIRRNLAIRPLSHGQLHTSLIAIAEEQKPDLTLERRELIESSLVQHQSNLVPLIVRRSEAYGEDFEYEVVYGAEWLQIAQELNIETLWTWVFDMTDEQAEAAQTEMQQLLSPADISASEHRSVPKDSTTSADSANQISTAQLSDLIDRKLNLVSESIKQSVNSSLNALKNETDEKLKNISYRLSDVAEGLASSSQLLEAIADLNQQLQTIGTRRRSTSVNYDGPKIDLTQATDRDITAALQAVGTQTKQIDAALKAIDRCKTVENGLTWRNLADATKGKPPRKIAGFAEGTLERLRAIGTLPGDE